MEEEKRFEKKLLKEIAEGKRKSGFDFNAGTDEERGY